MSENSLQAVLVILQRLNILFSCRIRLARSRCFKQSSDDQSKKVALIFSVAMFNISYFCLFDWTLTVINLAFFYFVYTNRQNCGSGLTFLASFFTLVINFLPCFWQFAAFSCACNVKFYLKIVHSSVLLIDGFLTLLLLF